jgi:hypothetical protein
MNPGFNRISLHPLAETDSASEFRPLGGPANSEGFPGGFYLRLHPSMLSHHNAVNQFGYDISWQLARFLDDLIKRQKHAGIWPPSKAARARLH